MKKLAYLFAPILCAFALTSCGGGSPTPADQYNLTVNCEGCTIEGMSNYSHSYQKNDKVDLKFTADSERRFTQDSFSGDSSNFRFDYETGELSGFMDKSYTFTISAYSSQDTYKISFDLSYCTIEGSEGSKPVFEYAKNKKNIVFNLVSANENYEFNETESIWKKNIDSGNYSFEIDASDKTKAKLTIFELKRNYNFSIESKNVERSLTCNFRMSLYFCDCPSVTVHEHVYEEKISRGTYISLDIYADAYSRFDSESFVTNDKNAGFTFEYNDDATIGTLAGYLNSDFNCSLIAKKETNYVYCKYNRINCKLYKKDGLTVREITDGDISYKGYSNVIECYANAGYYFVDDSCVYNGELDSNYSFIVDSKDNTHATLTYSANTKTYFYIAAIDSMTNKFTLDINFSNCYSLGDSGHYSKSYYGNPNIIVPIKASSEEFKLDSSCCKCTSDPSFESFTFNKREYEDDFLCLQFTLTDNVTFNVSALEEHDDVKLNISFIYCNNTNIINETHTYGDVVTIRVQAANNYIFDSSSLSKPSDCDCTFEIDPKYPNYADFQVTMNGNYSFIITAVDAPLMHDLVVDCKNCSIKGKSDPHIEESFYKGAKITLNVVADEGYILTEDSVWSQFSDYVWTVNENNPTEAVLEVTMPDNSCHFSFKTTTPKEGYNYLSVRTENCYVEESELFGRAYLNGTTVSLQVKAADGYSLTDAEFSFPTGSDFKFTIDETDDTKGIISGTVSGNYNLSISTETLISDYYTLTVSCTNVKVNGKPSLYTNRYLKETPVELSVQCDPNYILDSNSFTPTKGFTLEIDNDKTKGVLKGVMIEDNINLTISTNTESYSLNVAGDNCLINGSSSYNNSFKKGEFVSLNVEAVDGGTLNENFDDKGSDFVLELSTDKKFGTLKGTMDSSYSFNIEGFSKYSNGVSRFAEYTSDPHNTSCNLLVTDNNFEETEYQGARNAIFIFLHECGLKLDFEYDSQHELHDYTSFNQNVHCPLFDSSEYAFSFGDSSKSSFKLYDDYLYAKSNCFITNVLVLQNKPKRTIQHISGDAECEMKINSAGAFLYFSMNFTNYRIWADLEGVQLYFTFNGSVTIEATQLL